MIKFEFTAKTHLFGVDAAVVMDGNDEEGVGIDITIDAPMADGGGVFSVVFTRDLAVELYDDLGDVLNKCADGIDDDWSIEAVEAYNGSPSMVEVSNHHDTARGLITFGFTSDVSNVTVGFSRTVIQEFRERWAEVIEYMDASPDPDAAWAAGTKGLVD